MTIRNEAVGLKAGALVLLTSVLWGGNPVAIKMGLDGMPPAALAGQRYCVDGAATVFYPADGSAPVRGEFDPQKPRELPAWAQPPGIKVNG